MLKQAILIVLYNQYIENSHLIRNFINFDFKDVYVFDNSNDINIYNANKDFCIKKFIKFHTKNYNVGLSIAYNLIIKNLINLNYDWITIFDQDSEIDNNFFNELNLSIVKNPQVYVHIPIVKVLDNNSKSFILSPKPLTKIKFNNFQIIKYKRKIVNSGITINTNVFYKIGFFNESLFLDFIDHDFFDRFYKLYTNVSVFNSVLTQNFSGITASSLSSSITRYKIFLKDSKVFCLRFTFSPFIFLYLNFKRIIKLTVFYRSLKFIQIFLSNG